MRGLLVLPLLVVLVLLPAASAQLGEDLTVSAAEARPLKPGQDIGTLALTATVSCRFMAITGIEIVFEVVSKPTWAEAIVSPSSLMIEGDRCLEGQTHVTGTAAVTYVVSRDAPANAPAPVDIRATVEGNAHEAEATTTFDVEALWFGQLDVVVLDAIKETEAGQTTEHRFTVTNAGNGPVSVSVERTSAPEGVVVRLPAAVLVGSKAQGAANVAELVVRVETPPTPGLAHSIQLRVVGAHPTDASQAKSEHPVSLLVETTGAEVPEAKTVPLAPWAVLGALAVTAVRRRLPRRG